MPLYIPRDRQSLFRQFLAGMYDAVVITDPMGYILEVNKRAEEYFEIINEEVIDRPIGNLISGLTQEIVQRIRKGLAEDRHMMIDGNGIKQGGAKFPCEVTVSALDLNSPDDLVFTIRNTERRKLLMTSLRAKANAFKHAHAALFACNPAGEFIEVNDQFLAMFDVDSEEAAKRLDFTSIFDDEPLPTNFKKALEGEETVTGIIAKGEDDTKEEIEIILAPSREGRKITGVVGSVIKV